MAGLPARLDVGKAWTGASSRVDTIPERSWDSSLRTSSLGSMVVRKRAGRWEDRHWACPPRGGLERRATASLFVTHAHQMVFNVDTGEKRLLRPGPAPPMP